MLTIRIERSLGYEVYEARSYAVLRSGNQITIDIEDAARSHVPIVIVENGCRAFVMSSTGATVDVIGEKQEKKT